MLMHVHRGLVALVLTLVAGSAPSVAAASEAPMSTAQTFETALNGGDSDALVALFTHDAVIVQLTGMGAAPRTFVGDEQIRWWARNLVDQHAQVELEGQADSGEGEVAWRGSLALEPWRRIGIAAVATTFEASLEAGYVTSLTIVPTPAAVRQLSGVAPQPDTELESGSERAALQPRLMQLGGLDLALPLLLSFALGAMTSLRVARHARAGLGLN